MTSKIEDTIIDDFFNSDSDLMTKPEPTKKVTIKKQKTKTVRPNDRVSERTVKPSVTKKENKLDSIEKDLNQPKNERETARDSFEIYIDQQEKIEELRFLYYKKTKNKLAKSRIIREALDRYLNHLETLLQ